MKVPEKPENEKERLAALRDLEILDTCAEETFDNIVTLIANILEVPIAAISLVDDDRQWFKARVGLEPSETSRDVSFCGHVVASGCPLVVRDTHEDNRFCDNPLVTSGPKVRFYAGWPLQTKDNHVLGTLCVLDNKERQISSQQLESLRLLASQVVTSIELRKVNQQLESVRQVSENQRSLLAAIAKAQDEFISGESTKTVFDKLLANLLAVTESKYGFIGEVRRTPEGQPYLKTHAITNISWNEETRKLYDENARSGLEFYNLKTLFGLVLTTEEPLISNNPASDPRRGGLPEGHPPMHSFLGAPIKKQGAMIGMIGVANRPNGYTEELVDSLEPFLATCGSLINAHKASVAKEAAEQSRREYSEKLAKTVEQLRSSNHDLSQFAYIVSHDLQAPLRHISTYVDIIVEEVGDDLSDEMEEAVDIVQTSTNRLRLMISDILAYSRVGKESNSMSLHNLGELCERAVGHVLAGKTESDITLKIGPLPVITCDGSLISQVFQNLIQNAVKYRNHEIPLEITVSGQETEKCVQISVQDNGIGISPEHHERIFKMFKRLPQSAKIDGSGIGLSICRKVVEYHGGRIWLESEPGRGSCFIFTLPKMPDVRIEGSPDEVEEQDS